MMESAKDILAIITDFLLIGWIAAVSIKLEWLKIEVRRTEKAKWSEGSEK